MLDYCNFAAIIIFSFSNKIKKDVPGFAYMEFEFLGLSLSSSFARNLDERKTFSSVQIF